MTVPQTIPTGKNNMLGSLKAYLRANLPLAIPSGTYAVELGQYENAESYPSISFEDVGMPGLGGHAFDRFLGDGIDESGNKIKYYGKIAQTMVDFNCQSNMNDQPQDALQQCYQMRDQLEYLLMNSGEYDHAGVQILPPIQLMNYDTNPASSTGSCIWAPMEKDSIWFETFIGNDEARVGIKRLNIRVRIYWHLLEI